MIEVLRERARTSIGYPLWTNPVAADAIKQFADLTVNNLGDPFEGSNYGVNSMDLECKVVEYFQRLLHFPGWGYVTNGSTISNLHAIYAGREKTGSRALTYSAASHYSIPSAAKILSMQSNVVEADHTGRASIAADGVVVFNVGTTMTGAMDEVVQNLSPESYVHVDAALSGMVLPFTSGAANDAFFDLLTQADSVCVSGHKMPGSPINCSVLLFREKPEGVNIEYINSNHVTIAGSRSGHAVIALAAALELPWEGIVACCLRSAESLVERLNAETKVNAWRHEDSITVVFERLSQRIEQKWQLACQGRQAHVVVMPHVDEQLIEEFVTDVREDSRRAKRSAIAFVPKRTRKPVEFMQ